MVWTDPVAFHDGAPGLSASDLNVNVRDNLKAIGDAWASYTPTLTGITVGNGTLIGKYLQAGKLVIGRVLFVAGSTSTYSASTFLFTLPTALAATYNAAAQVDVFGACSINNGTSATRYNGSVVLASATQVFLQVGVGGAGTVTNTVPFTFGTNSRIGFQFTYEGA